MDALTTLLRPITFLLLASIASQFLFWLRQQGIVSPAHWAILLLAAGLALFFVAIHYFGWKDAAILSLALAIGLGLGMVGGLA